MSDGFNFPDAIPELSGERVDLRGPCERDIPAWFARATDAESADLAGDPVPRSIEDGGAWLQRHRDRFSERGAIRWSIAVAGSSESIGTVGLTVTSTERRIGELCIVIGRAYWGRGFGTSAARAATAYAFSALGLAAIHAEVLQRNVASVRLLEKVGFHLLRAVDAAAPDGEACFIYVLPRPGDGAA